MKNPLLSLILILFVLVNICGCVPLIVGGAVGALGGYAVTRDTIQGESDKPFDLLWNSALTVAGYRGIIKEQDTVRGYIKMEVDSSLVWIKLIRLTQATARLRVSARKHHLPNITLAQDIFVKIIEGAR